MSRWKQHKPSKRHYCLRKLTLMFLSHNVFPASAFPDKISNISLLARITRIINLLNLPDQPN